MCSMCRCKPCAEALCSWRKKCFSLRAWVWGQCRCNQQLPCTMCIGVCAGFCYYRVLIKPIFLLFSLNPPSLLSSLSCSLLSPNLWLPSPVFHHSLHTSPNQPEKQKLVVVSMSPHSRASIASKYNLPASEVGTYISGFIVPWAIYYIKQVYRCSRLSYSTYICCEAQVRAPETCRIHVGYTMLFFIDTSFWDATVCTPAQYFFSLVFKSELHLKVLSQNQEFIVVDLPELGYSAT